MFRWGQLTWLDREGNKLETVGEPAQIFPENSLSPDNKRAVATVRSENGRDNLWIYDLARVLVVGLRSALKGSVSLYGLQTDIRNVCNGNVS